LKRILTGVLALGLLLALIPAATMGAPDSKHVVIHDLGAVPTGDGAFIARGPAVRAGWVCASGTSTTGATTVYRELGPFVWFTTSKQFTCADGSSLWSADLDVRLNRDTGRTIASLAVDPVADLDARGRLRGVPVVLGESIVDIYRGRVRQATP
jgi:hypothetical protein